MKYTKEQLEAMSDLQVNEIISDLQGMWVQTEFGENIGLTLSFRERYPSTVWARSKDNLSGWEQFNYCLSPEDMMPLVFDRRIAICPCPSTDCWVAISECKKHAFEDDNPLRACAIVCILVKQSEAV